MPIPKEEIEKALKIKGKVNGMALLEDKKFVLEYFGEEKLKELEREISEIVGEGFSYEKIKSYKEYPFYLTLITTLFLHYNCGKDETFIRNFGKESMKFSLIVKLFLKYAFSPQGVVKYGSQLWRKYFSIGDLEVKKFSEEEKEVLIELRNFDVHPLFCKQIEGAIEQLFSYVVKSENLKNEEIECPFKGGKVHRFKISW